MHRDMADERAPSTADIEESFARLEPQLAADHVELVALRRRQVVAPILDMAVTAPPGGVQAGMPCRRANCQAAPSLPMIRRCRRAPLPPTRSDRGRMGCGRGGCCHAWSHRRWWVSTHALRRPWRSIIAGACAWGSGGN